MSATFEIVSYVDAAVAEASFASNAVCVAVETGLLASEVLSTFPSPTIDFVIPCTVPVKVGFAEGALVPTKVARVAAVDSSAVRASASSLSVLRASGAELTTAATAVDAALSA